MQSFDNYIFFTICEKSLIIFQKTNSTQYRSFCNYVKLLIETDNFDDNDWINELVGYLILVYGFDWDEAMFYIKRFFIEEIFTIFEIPTRTIKNFFITSFN